MTVLPQILLVFDWVIDRTEFNRGAVNREKIEIDKTAPNTDSLQSDETVEEENGQKLVPMISQEEGGAENEKNN